MSACSIVVVRSSGSGKQGGGLISSQPIAAAKRGTLPWSGTAVESARGGDGGGAGTLDWVDAFEGSALASSATAAVPQFHDFKTCNAPSMFDIVAWLSASCCMERKKSACPMVYPLNHH